MLRLPVPDRAPRHSNDPSNSAILSQEGKKITHQFILNAKHPPLVLAP